MIKKIATGLLIASLFNMGAKAQSLKPFVKGDRVVFLGNSITEAGFYESNIWLYYMTRFPDQRITVFNAGIGGDVVGQMNNRFEDDVLIKKPSVVVLTFGMNDTGYFEFNEDNAAEKAKQRFNKSYQNFKLIEAKLLAQPTIKTVLMASSPYDETVKNTNNYFKGKYQLMEQIADFQQESAKTNGWGFVDLLHPITAINAKMQQTDPAYTLTGPDRIHPGKAGHLAMSAFFLENQGLAGKPVANVTVDVASKLIEVENAKVTFNKNSKAALAINYIANALPFPIDSASNLWDNPQKQSDFLSVYPFIKNFNQEILKVKSLNPGLYELRIDGLKITTVSADSLAKGVNMAVLSNTPQYQQAIAVMSLNELRNELEKKIRDYYWLQFNYFKGENMLYVDSQLALDKVLEKAKADWAVRSKIGTYQTARFPAVRTMWEKNIKELTDQIYQVNQPNLHLIELVAIK